jgi:DGQHR domain-containing protein
MTQFTVNALVLKQNGIGLYLFPMNSKYLRKICFVAPRGNENPEEIQRLLKPKRAQEIGEYIKQPTSVLPNAIVINLPNTVKILPTAKENEVTLQFPDNEGKFGYILDGQHRLAGFEYSEGIEFDLPVVALHNADEHMRGKVFADINSKQEKVSDVHILELYYQIKELPTDETATMDIVHRLSKDR